MLRHAGGVKVAVNAPCLSIVVPTCGRGRQLAELLDRLSPERQHVPAADFEVIVSDDAPASSDNDDRPARYPAIRFVAGPGRGPAANRNHGARYARGEWLVFVDDDCEPVKGWLRALQDATRSGPVDVLEGSIVAPYKQDTIFHRYVENVAGNCFWSANLAIRRDVFEALGGFDEDFGEAGGEDMELAFRMKAGGLRAVFCRDARVVHPPHVMSWKEWLRYQFGIRWHVLYQLKTRQTLPPETSMWRVVPYVVHARLAGLARLTWRALRRPDPDRPRTVALETLLHWVLLPCMLPHIVYWELRFRRMLRERDGHTT